MKKIYKSRIKKRLKIVLECTCVYGGRAECRDVRRAEVSAFPWAHSVAHPAQSHNPPPVILQIQPLSAMRTQGDYSVFLFILSPLVVSPSSSFIVALPCVATLGL